jgi:hypothetical protein
MPLGILTSFAVVAAAIYGIAFAVGSANQARGLSADGAIASSHAPDTGRSSLPGPFA